MASSFDPGLAAEAVISLLSSNLAAKLDTLDTEYGDITLRDIAAFYRAMPGTPNVYPCISVYASGRQETEGQYATFNLRGHLLECRIWEVAMDATSTLLPVEVLQKRLERTVRACEEVLHENRGLTVTGTNKASIDEIGPAVYLGYDTIGENDNQRVVRPASLPLRVLVN